MELFYQPEVQRVQRIPSVEALLEEVCSVTGMGFAAIAHVTSERWVACQVLDRVEFGLNPGDELDIKTTICDGIRESGRSVFIDQVSLDTEWRRHPIPALYGFESYVSVPIVLPDGNFFGTLCAIDPVATTVRLADVMVQVEAMAQTIAHELGRQSGRSVEGQDQA
ncbi:GAF domain-containing protein [Sphingomonas sp. LT1P40]|uniref:GAF domain-containing protein n=1 Tax=Alteristakelama amylovorans TaxID=3096166 RepID=UPI002FCAE350